MDMIRLFQQSLTKIFQSSQIWIKRDAIPSHFERKMNCDVARTQNASLHELDVRKFSSVPTCLRVPIPVVKRLWCGASAGVKWGSRGRAGYSDRNSAERCLTAPARAPLPRSRTALAQRMSATSRSSFVLSRLDHLNLELRTQSRFVSWIVIAVPKSERNIS